MPLVGLVERVRRREKALGKSTDWLVPNPDVGSLECPHCHECHHYGTQDFIPGERRVH